MSELSFQQQASLWGQAYEIFVKRGVLACLIETKFLSPEHEALKSWKATRLMEVSTALIRHLDILDDVGRARVKAAAEHIALTAFGVGYTATREYLNHIGKARNKLKLRALWCPLVLPGDETALELRRKNDREAFYREFGIEGLVDEHRTTKGQPVNADFILWLSGTAKEDYLLVQEYSFDMPGELPDFKTQGAHLDELIRYRKLMDSRSVFARVTAEVRGERFELSDDIRNHLSALTGRNKPFYKLCQACSYADNSALWFRDAGILTKPCHLRALALTPNGLESLAARDEPDASKDPRRSLMAQMGEAYRNASKLKDGDEDGLTAQVRGVFTNIVRRLPKEFKKGVKALSKMPGPNEDLDYSFSETVPKFSNPAEQYSLEQALELVEESAAINEFFGAPAKSVFKPILQERLRKGKVSLRDLHASAVVAGMQRAVPGEVNVLALEGNPGIGKTTAVRRHLEKKTEGYLFLYVSPRVVINRDVTGSLANLPDNGGKSGILTVTTSADIISGARAWHQNEVECGRAEPKYVEGAVVVDGVVDLVKPDGSVLILTPEQEEEIDASFADSGLVKDTYSENEDMVRERRLVGVLSGMSSTAKELLALNPDINRIVLTAALQGFRERAGGKTTIDALSSLFNNKSSEPAGARERKAFAKRIPNIVVMVDELAGDGAGSPFVHAVADWLHKEFIECFEDPSGKVDSPFTVTLIVSDASLGNDVVLTQYLEAGERAPDKVLVSESRGNRAFDLAVSAPRIGSGRPKRTLHVMTNSFPASELAIDYRVRLTSISPTQRASGELETARQAIRRHMGDALLENAKEEVLGALNKGAVQVIYFAQDKNFLNELRSQLCAEPGLDLDNVVILDSSVPGPQKKKLIEPSRRDACRVFLMTSSGARGVSFPKADWIIAAVPRFDIEKALMEIAQLIYRGRGSYRNERGEEVSGDNACRHLVMTVDDFLIEDEQRDVRHWLRQSIDLLTLLVMLRSTIYTRITGDAGLQQPLALVPVGAVGVEELVNVMAQNVSKFVREADIAMGRGLSAQRLGLAKSAQAGVVELFSRLKLASVPGDKNKDNRTMVRRQDVLVLVELVSSPIGPLLVFAKNGLSIPDHVYVSGPAFVENWGHFEKMEAFRFEGHTTEINETAKKVLGMFALIDRDSGFSSGFRQPAANLRRILQREKKGAANEFTTLKQLKSPNTWVSVPTGYLQFMDGSEEAQSGLFETQDPDVWRIGLASSLASRESVMPPIPRYDSFPWAASVGNVNPLKFDTVFDDRYFMSSNELNLLNMLLLADSGRTGGS